MRPIPEIEADLERLNEAIRPLAKDRESVERELREAKSKEWIRVNNVTHDKIRLSSGNDVPWFIDIYSFSDWLNKHDVTIEFCEWNNRIYRTASVRQRLFSWDDCGHMNHVPQRE